MGLKRKSPPKQRKLGWGTRQISNCTGLTSPTDTVFFLLPTCSWARELIHAARRADQAVLSKAIQRLGNIGVAIRRITRNRPAPSASVGSHHLTGVLLHSPEGTHLGLPPSLQNSSPVPHTLPPEDGREVPLGHVGRSRTMFAQFDSPAWLVVHASIVFCEEAVWKRGGPDEPPQLADAVELPLKPARHKIVFPLLSTQVSPGYLMPTSSPVQVIP